MDTKEIFKLAELANTACEMNNYDTRYWIDYSKPNKVKYLICNNIIEMDDIDEVSEKEFVSRIKTFLK